MLVLLELGVCTAFRLLGACSLGSRVWGIGMNFVIVRYDVALPLALLRMRKPPWKKLQTGAKGADKALQDDAADAQLKLTPFEL